MTKSEYYDLREVMGFLPKIERMIKNLDEVLENYPFANVTISDAIAELKERHCKYESIIEKELGVE